MMIDLVEFSEALLKAVVKRGGIVALRDVTSLEVARNVPPHLVKASMRKLMDLGLARSDCSELYATRIGKSRVAELSLREQAQRYVGEIVPPRAVFVPVKKNRPAAPIRPGSDDWKAVPSRMGDVCRLPSGEVVG